MFSVSRIVNVVLKSNLKAVTSGLQLNSLYLRYLYFSFYTDFMSNAYKFFFDKFEVQQTRFHLFPEYFNLPL